MRKFLKLFFEFDYDIVGEYYDSDGRGHFKKKYLKRHKFRRKGGITWHYLPIR